MKSKIEMKYLLSKSSLLSTKDSKLYIYKENVPLYTWKLQNNIYVNIYKYIY